MLSGIVRSVTDVDSELFVVAEVRHVTRVRAAVIANGATVVVANGLDVDETAELAAELFAVDPGIRLIVIDADGSAATNVTARAHRRVVSPSPESLLELMRG
jgi:NAD(P)H-hydrate repair Nnr-like enzyme with NAD(P)H-hydrate dehydratase domain